MAGVQGEIALPVSVGNAVRPQKHNRAEKKEKSSGAKDKEVKKSDGKKGQTNNESVADKSHGADQLEKKNNRSAPDQSHGANRLEKKNKRSAPDQSHGADRFESGSDPLDVAFAIATREKFAPCSPAAREPLALQKAVRRSATEQSLQLAPFTPARQEPLAQDAENFAQQIPGMTPTEVAATLTPRIKRCRSSIDLRTPVSPRSDSSPGSPYVPAAQNDQLSQEVNAQHEVLRHYVLSDLQHGQADRP